VTGASGCERGLEGVVAAVAEGVVGHHRLGWRQAELDEVRDRSLEEARARLASLVTVLLDVGVAAVIVDGGVDKHVAPAVLLAAGVGRASAHAVPRPPEGWQAGGIHMKQRPQPRPLVASGRCLRLAAAA
jgi:hypothetical protein